MTLFSLAISVAAPIFYLTTVEPFKLLPAVRMPLSLQESLISHDPGAGRDINETILLLTGVSFIECRAVDGAPVYVGVMGAERDGVLASIRVGMPVTLHPRDAQFYFTPDVVAFYNDRSVAGVVKIYKQLLEGIWKFYSERVRQAAAKAH